VSHGKKRGPATVFVAYGKEKKVSKWRNPLAERKRVMGGRGAHVISNWLSGEKKKRSDLNFALQKLEGREGQF